MPISLLSHYASVATPNSYATKFLNLTDLQPAPRYFAYNISPRYSVYVSPFGYSYLFGYEYFIRCGSKGVFRVGERLDGVYVVMLHEFATLQEAINFGLMVKFAMLQGYQITAKNLYGFTLG